MANDVEEIEWTEDEKHFLRIETLFAKANAIRATNGTGSRKPGWQRFLESTGGTALITVVVGGIFGTIISASFQSASKDREFQQTWLKTRGDQAMVGYKDFLDNQQETVKRIFERVGSLTSASEDLISLSKPELTLNNRLSSPELQGISEERKKIKEKYSGVNREWLNECDMLGMLVSYYFPNMPNSVAKQSSPLPAESPEVNVALAWDKVKDSVNQYTDCSEKWANNPYPREPIGACLEQKTTVVNSLIGLNKSLELNRRYTWEGWENPEKLRKILADNSQE